MHKTRPNFVAKYKADANGASEGATQRALAQVQGELFHSTHLIVSSQCLQSNGDDVDSCMRSTLMCVLVFIF